MVCEGTDQEYFNFYLFLTVLLQVDGLCYLLQEIYGIENKINQKSGKVCTFYTRYIMILLCFQ